MTTSYVNPTQIFSQELLDRTQSFIHTLKKKQIKLFRTSYIREINGSNETNETPEYTLEQRRCFLYLTYPG